MFNTARLGQIILNAIMALLVGVAGMTSQDAQPIAVPAAALVVALILFLVNELMHSSRYAKYVGMIEALGGDPTASAPTSPASDSNGNLTKTATSLLLIGAVAVGAFAIAGCGATEKKKIGQAAIDVNAAAIAGDDLFTQHQMSPATAQSYVDALQTAEAAIDAWNVARLQGDSDAISEAAAAVLAADNQLGIVLAQAQAVAATKKAAATTQPAK